MTNLVLYRKYRPQTFAKITGQEYVVQTLTNAITSGMISHAYLFSGPRGTGKTTVARLLAKAVNCENRENNSYWRNRKIEAQTSKWAEEKSTIFEKDLICNECSSCKEIMEGRSMDLIEIDAASHRGIDEVRDLRDGIRVVPTKSKYKVYIVDEAHQLTRDAANALLKTLEEPPAHAIFVLATTEIHKMIPTILSRCQRFDFRKLTVLEIIKRLEYICQKEKAKIEKPALEIIAINAGGSIRDAESLLDQVLTFSGAMGNKEIKSDNIKDLLGLVEIGALQEFTDLILQKKKSEALQFLNQIIERGSDLQEFTKALINYLRQGLILKLIGEGQGQNPILAPLENQSFLTGITGLTQEEFEKLKKQTADFQTTELQRILNLLLEAETKMKYSPIPQLPLELAIIEAIGD